MGKSKIGNFIRKIDYLNAKERGDYENSADYPGNQLRDLEHYSREEMTFEDFKDAYAAFEEKICIKGFPERRTGASDVANITGHVLTDLANYKETYLPEKRTEMAAVMFHALVALVKAGPCSTQRELMEQIRKHRSPNIEEYAQTIGRGDLVDVMSAAKVEIQPLINTAEDADSYNSFHEDDLEFFFAMFTKDQYKLVQKEFLDTYIHFHRQIPYLPEYYGLRVYYLVRSMPGQFDNENPYTNLKDGDIIKNHLTVVKEMLLAKGYTHKNPVDQAAEMTMKTIMKAAINDGYLEDMFDHMVSVLVDLHKNENFRKQGENIYKVYSYTLFRDCLEGKQVVQHAKMYKGCVNLVAAFVAQGKLTSESEQVLEYAIKRIIESVKTVSLEDLKVTLSMIDAMLGSGRIVLIKKGESLLKHLKKIKALDWKKQLNDAKQLLATIAKIKIEDIEGEQENEKIADAYVRHTKLLRDQLKKDKVLPKLQPNLVEFVFNCMLISSPLKADLAEELSGRDYLDISKHENLRLVILQKFGDMLKIDLSWDEADMIRTIGNVLGAVVRSYDDNGKLVTVEENELFMSIFKIVSEGGESVEEHFYQEEYEDRPNHRMQIWRNILSDYVRLHQETATLTHIVPIMPEVLRWAKISLEEDHDDMMRVCYGIIQYVGSGATPTEFKACLPELVDLMLESEKFSEFYPIINSLYPEAPDALHDRLQDIFDKMDDMKDSDLQMLTCLLYTVSQKHPEVFQQQHIAKLFEKYKTAEQGSQGMILMVIKTIGEKHPKKLVEFLPTLCDSMIFKPNSMSMRSSIIAGIGGVNKQLGEKVIDYLMNYVDDTDPTVSHIVTSTTSTMVRAHVEYMQKYKQKLEKLEVTTTVPAVKDVVHDMILVLEGKSVENIAEDIEQQKEDIADLDTKVDATMDTVITIGDKVIEHDKEIGELEEGLEKIEERVDDVEEEQEEAKIKIEEIDNKTMTNAPKWSRDLTKLMNPEAEADWRLLASRLGYSNDDIRGWATQHDPCMALLSEWYATHKTSEANYGVLTALVEMNRMDGAAIVENAMKTAEGVVEDEEFEYASPPPVFLSYQWGFQNEVKLLKHHLNMAGYECWMDVGQMGGGDKLFAKIDNGIRGAKVVICCTTEKYAQSPNCNREVNLSVNLNKPIIPLLMEKMDWPPKGSMGPIFSEYLFIRFFQRGGEETPESDQRYWPIPKFQELLMQLNFYVVPDEKLVQKEYARWWAPMVEDIIIDKNKGKNKESSNNSSQKSEVVKFEESPLVFLSYQWGKQPQVKALYQRLTAHGYTAWMDIYQMGGGDSLYDKIDRGMRGCKCVVSCVTQKYSLSANCRREVSLADALKKPIIPLLLEDIKWPPDGPMSMVFTQLLYINFHRDEAVQMTWKGDQFEELRMKLGELVPETGTNTNNNSVVVSNDVSPKKSQTPKMDLETAKKQDSKEKVNSTAGHGSEESKIESSTNNKGTTVAKDVGPANMQTPKKNQETTKNAVLEEKSTNSTTVSAVSETGTGTNNKSMVVSKESPQTANTDQRTNGRLISKDKSTNSTTGQRSVVSDTGTRSNNKRMVVPKESSQASKKDPGTNKKIISEERSFSSATGQGSALSETGRSTNNKSTVITKEGPKAAKKDLVTNKRNISMENSNNSTTGQNSAGSAAGIQKRGPGVQTSDKTPTFQNSTVKKAVAVRAFGGSIAKDKIAQDIAAGKRSTTPRSGSTLNKGKATNGAKSETLKNDPTPARSALSVNSSSVTSKKSLSSISGKGTTTDKSTKKMTTGNSNTEETVEKGKKETENITSHPRQNNKEADFKESQYSSKQVNGDSNEPKSKSCVII